MYIPEHFEETNMQQLQSLIRDQGFGILVVAGGAGIEVNHVPFYLNTSGDSPFGVLECHVARKNAVWQQVEAGADILVIFQGPNAYVSPSWYATKAETGRVVPTWNYQAVHVTGQAKVIHDPDWLLGHVSRLTDHHESGREAPWSVGDAPQDFTERLTQSIVGFEITVEKMTGKRKASQNQPERNRAGVIEGLNREGTELSRAMAKLTD